MLQKIYSKKLLFPLLLLLSLGLYSAPSKQLTQREIRSIMEEIFSYHVEHKAFAPLLIKRSCKLLVEQFDPYKMYLLKDEIAAFFELSDEIIKRIIEHYDVDNFSEYAALNQILQKAVLRAQAIRSEIKRELILHAKEPELPIGEGSSYLAFASSEHELRLRIKNQMIRLFLEEKKFHSLKHWSAENRAKVFELWEKRLQRKENTYLSHERSEHYFSEHLLKAFAKSLDAHSAFFSPEEAEEMRASLEKQFQGIGVVLRESIEGVTIADFVKGGPAEKNGEIAIGDVIIEIDGKTLLGATYEEVLDRMKGEAGSQIRLAVKRNQADGNAKTIRVDIKREKIALEKERLQVSFEAYGDGIIGKLTLPSFYESSTLSSAEADMRNAIKKLKKEGNLKGLILDLRENSGGFLNQAVKIAGLFITRGVIVISKYAKGEVKYLRDIDGRIFYDGPFLILTSKASASAAEIVAQALQDYGAAIIVGDDRTYGKGTIQYQTVTDENAKAFFKVTVGKYYTVSGKSTQIEGVKADVVVPTAYSIYHIGERFLEYPLANDQMPSAFIDPLTDIQPKDQGWFQKNYSPHLHQPGIQWSKMIQMLSKNSQFRLNHDKNFLLFSEYLQDPQKFKQKADIKNSWGKEDLQMAEAVHILKDMIVSQNSDRMQK